MGVAGTAPASAFVPRAQRSVPYPPRRATTLGGKESGMRSLAMRLGLLGLGMLWLAVAPALADTAAGLAAFKNKDYQLAYREWKESAEAGRAEAQFDLGVLYAQGKGVRRDL